MKELLPSGYTLIHSTSRQTKTAPYPKSARTCNTPIYDHLAFPPYTLSYYWTLKSGHRFRYDYLRTTDYDSLTPVFEILLRSKNFNYMSPTGGCFFNPNVRPMCFAKVFIS